MSKLSFTKYEGAGNDFILIDDRTLSFSEFKRITELCHRQFGIGANGLILLQPSVTADFRMRIFNADGSEAESCGNGLRCLGRFLLDLGLASKNYRIEICNKTTTLSFTGQQIGVQMGQPEHLQLHLPTEIGSVHFVDTGVPHVVHFVKDAETTPLKELGPLLRSHPLFQPKGANVNFVSRKSDGSFRVRTFERGVEGETLACGTGACAVAAIAAKLYAAQNPITLHFTGGILEVCIQPEGLIQFGPAKLVFQGTIDSFRI